MTLEPVEDDLASLSCRCCACEHVSLALYNRIATVVRTLLCLTSKCLDHRLSSRTSFKPG